jgi:tripartite-type tricarboxylate transporter receptor subunit TctC
MSNAKRILATAALAAFWSAPAIAQDFPSGPIELVCTTKAGSGAANWCQMIAAELQKPEYLGVPITVTFKSGGSNHEPALYVAGKEADGQTLMHVSGSFYGYFNLPHFTVSYEDFQLLAQVERHLYGVAVRCDDPDIKSWADLVEFAKANPDELAMGSNKVGSIHHRHHVALYDAAGIDVRFVPYEGTGDVVKDVIGGHLRVGFAQPGLWNPHIDAGTICPLALLNEERLTEDENWKDVPTILEAGVEYRIPHQWQGFMVKAGTPPERMDILASALEKLADSEDYKAYLSKQPHVVPNLETDRTVLDEDMQSNMASTKEFMVENEILQN